MVSAENERGDAVGEDLRHDQFNAAMSLADVSVNAVDVAEVGDGDAIGHVYVEPRFVGRGESQGVADAVGAKPAAWPRHDRGIERHADNTYVSTIGLLPGFQHVGDGQSELVWCERTGRRRSEEQLLYVGVQFHSSS